MVERNLAKVEVGSSSLLSRSKNFLKQIEISATMRVVGQFPNRTKMPVFPSPDLDTLRFCWPVLRRYFGAVRPAATMISAALVDPRLRIEIEVTALKNQ